MTMQEYLKSKASFIIKHFGESGFRGRAASMEKKFTKS